LIRRSLVGSRFVNGGLVNRFLCNDIGCAHNSPFDLTQQYFTTKARRSRSKANNSE
jgi:hypothetical protein